MQNDASVVWTGVATALLLASALVQWILGLRQVRHVLRHRSAVPAAFAGAVGLAAHQRAADYTVAKVQLGMWALLVSSAVWVGWTLLGGLSALNQFLAQQMGGGFGQQLALLAAFAVVSAVLDLPLSAYQTFGLEQRFGFNTTTLRLWLTDGVKGALVATLLGLPLAALVLWLMSAAGTLWWLWAWGAWVGFNLLVLMVYPTWIAPWFNRFEPLRDEALRRRVEQLMQRCGFEAQGLFVMDGSRRSAHSNAYFTGFGKAKRVVFFDTLLQRLTPDEVEAVLAHELGHFHHRHILQRLLGMAVLSLAGFALLGFLAQQPWFYTGLGVVPNWGAPNDALALLLFVLTVPLLSRWLLPLLSRWSRAHEFQADAFAARMASAPALVSALIKLFADNASTLTPDPIYAAVYHSHPAAGQRIGRLMPPAAGHDR